MATICTLSDLPVEQCACRIHGPQVRQRRANDALPLESVVEARFHGTCPGEGCGGRIVPGDRIVYSPGAQAFVHEDCAAR